MEWVRGARLPEAETELSIEQNGAGKNAGSGLGNSVYVQFGCGLCAA